MTATLERPAWLQRRLPKRGEEGIAGRQIIIGLMYPWATWSACVSPGSHHYYFRHGDWPQFQRPERILVGHDDDRLLATSDTCNISYEMTAEGLTFALEVPEGWPGKAMLRAVRKGWQISAGFSALGEMTAADHSIPLLWDTLQSPPGNWLSSDSHDLEVTEISFVRVGAFPTWTKLATGATALDWRERMRLSRATKEGPEGESRRREAALKHARDTEPFFID